MLPCYLHFQMLQACLGQILHCKTWRLHPEKVEVETLKSKFHQESRDFFIITTKSSRKRLTIANKRRRELGKPRRCNDLVSLGPSGINLRKKLTGS